MDDRALHLMAGHVAGTLSDSEGQELVRLASTDEAVRAALQVQEATHRLLRARTSTTTNVASILAALPRERTSRRVLARLPRRLKPGKAKKIQWIAATAAALILCAVGFWSLRGETPTVAWTVATAQGQVTHRVDDAPSSLAPHERLSVGHAITVATDGTARLLGRDGTVLDLSRAAEVSVVADSTDLRRLRVTTGQVHAVVAKQRADARFILETPQVEITVVGTQFTVTVVDHVTTVSVEEGTVAVQPAQGPSERLVAGHRSRWPAEKVAPDAPATAEHEVIVKADADADADAAQPSASFGLKPGLQVRGGAQPRVSLLRFTVPSGKLARAQLVLHRTSGDADVQVHVQGVSGGWQENDLRWYHAPTKGRLVGTLREQDGLWTCEIPGLQPGVVELFLTTSARQATFGSREESGREPVMRIRLSP